MDSKENQLNEIKEHLNDPAYKKLIEALEKEPRKSKQKKIWDEYYKATISLGKVV